MEFSRRNFIKTGALATGATLWAPSVFASSEAFQKRSVCVFSKCLHFLNYEEMARLVAKVGFDGVDLTVRPEGHVLPENVTIDLPKAIKTLQKEGVKVPMMVTAIASPDEKYTEDLLSVAADQGIERYRMNWLRYDKNKSVLQNLDDGKRILERLEKLNRRYKIRGEYQNHSGSFGMIGGAVWDIYTMIKDIDPEYLGVQYDIMHATVEGIDVWKYGFDILKPWIGSLDIKDFKWIDNKSKVVQLGDGIVDYETYIKLVNSLKSNAPLSIHYEYELGGAELGKRNPTITVDEMAEHLSHDLDFVKQKFNI